MPFQMRERGGAIVNTASVQAFATQQLVAAYSASKGAIVSFTMTVALDHAVDHIRRNCIAPGSIQTPMLDMAANLFSAHDPNQALRDWGQVHPLGRAGTPEEVAMLVPFLASDDASLCTGGCYRIDGASCRGSPPSCLMLDRCDTFLFAFGRVVAPFFLVVFRPWAKKRPH